MYVLSLWGGGFGLPETVALAAVAAIGYLFGNRRSGNQDDLDQAPAEVVRAAEIARQLERVAESLRGDLASHQAEVDRFKKALDGAQELASDELSSLLSQEAERVLQPTLRLVGRVAKAYDQIRQQSSALGEYSGGRTDPLTGLCNRRSLNELLQIELAGHAAVNGQLSVALFGLPNQPELSQPEREASLVLAVELLRSQLRDSDLLARYGMDELVVVVPHTRLYGVSVFAHRVRAVLRESGLTVSCGLAQSTTNDVPQALLSRADSALYSAKAAGDDTQYLHNGRSIRADQPTNGQAAGDASQELQDESLMQESAAEADATQAPVGVSE